MISMPARDVRVMGFARGQTNIRLASAARRNGILPNSWSTMPPTARRMQSVSQSSERRANRPSKSAKRFPRIGSKSSIDLAHDSPRHPCCSPEAEDYPEAGNAGLKAEPASPWLITRPRSSPSMNRAIVHRVIAILSARRLCACARVSLPEEKD
jgi:hypothetical protein